MEITVNVTGLDNLANAIFALAKAAGNCKEETQVDATKVTPVAQRDSRTSGNSRTNNYNCTEHTTSTECTASTNNTGHTNCTTS